MLEQEDTPVAHAPRRAYEAPVIVDLGAAEDINRADAGGTTFDTVGYS